MKLNQIICFKPPTLYDVIMSIGLILILIISVSVQSSQTEMQKNYVTKDYIYNFYITKSQLKVIEDFRSESIKRIQLGENYDIVNSAYKNYIDYVLELTNRGSENQLPKPK